MSDIHYSESAFIGFTVNGIHSSSLGLLRVSDGSRYNENLLPPIKNIEIEIPGGHGSYYMGSSFGPKNFSISIAYDSITEEKFYNIKKLFSTDKLFKLIFDEAPYKYYNAKLQSSPNFRYLCFDGPHGQRIYRGEGTLDFIAFDPFGYSEKLFLEEFTAMGIDTSEWASASGMKNSGSGYNTFTLTGADRGEIKLYNAGLYETPFNLNIFFKNDIIPDFFVYLNEDTNTAIRLNNIEKKGADAAVRINTKLNLIEGLVTENSKLIPSGYIYNEYLEAGNFFKIPVSIEGSSDTKLLVLGLDTDYDISIDYKYIYL